jgi:hypothetical protein
MSHAHSDADTLRAIYGSTYYTDKKKPITIIHMIYVIDVHFFFKLICMHIYSYIYLLKIIVFLLPVLPGSVKVLIDIFSCRIYRILQPTDIHKHKTNIKVNIIHLISLYSHVFLYNRTSKL